MLTNSAIEFFHVEKTFRTLACQMCGNYSLTTSEIMKHYQKVQIFFLNSKSSIFECQTIVRKKKNQPR